MRPFKVIPGQGAEVVRLFIVHWNRPTECITTVNAFLDQAIPLAITVVDNASTADNLVTLVEQLPQDVSVVRLLENKGWGPALNVVLKDWLLNDEDEFCLISAHDALPQPDCLSLLAQSVINDPTLGIVCPEYGNAEVPRFSRLRCVRPVPAGRGVSGSVEIVDVANGTLMLLRRACLKDIGLFDERYFAYGDEHELGLRARRHNWRIGMVWGAITLNPGTWTSSYSRSYLYTRNSLLTTRSYAGNGWAILRLVLTIPNTIRLLIFPAPQGFAFSARARFAGLRDYVLNKYGPPPPG